MKVVILYDPGGPHWDQKDVAQVAESAEDIRDCLKAKGHQVGLLPIRLGDFTWIAKARKADVIFNLCEGLDGLSKYEDYVVGTLELRVPLVRQVAEKLILGEVRKTFDAEAETLRELATLV